MDEVDEKWWAERDERTGLYERLRVSFENIRDQEINRRSPVNGQRTETNTRKQASSDVFDNEDG